MARTYTRIQLELWANRDFLQLTPGAQWLYLHLVTTNTNNAGVLDWKPSRIVLKALGATHSDIEEWALELVEANFIVIDRASEEVLIRTWIRHDGVLKSPNIAKAMVGSLIKIGSRDIAEVVANEIRKELERDPLCRGAEHVQRVLEQFPIPNGNQVETLSDEYRNSIQAVSPKTVDLTQGNQSDTESKGLPKPFQESIKNLTDPTNLLTNKPSSVTLPKNPGDESDSTTETSDDDVHSFDTRGVF